MTLVMTFVTPATRVMMMVMVMIMMMQDDDGDGDDDVCYPCYAGACTLPAESQAWQRKIFKHREFTTYQNDIVEIG